VLVPPPLISKHQAQVAPHYFRFSKATHSLVFTVYTFLSHNCLEGTAGFFFIPHLEIIFRSFSILSTNNLIVYKKTNMFSPRALLISLLPLAAHAHMGMWHPSVLDFDGDGYTLVTPLSKLPFSDWWFHGLLSSPTPSSVFSLPAGGSVTVETACRRAYSSYGNEGDGKDGCPTDTPSYHAGTPIDDSQLLGCGLAIAYKNSFSDVQPADFTVFSVNHECIKQLRTEFKLPEVMKPCPEDGCICSWFWQGQDSDDEMVSACGLG
jgi:hypothetical protein